MDVAARAPGYRIRVEAEESLAVREFRGSASASPPVMRGPSVKVCLVQTGATTSRDFDWDYLLTLWPLMAAARADWVTAPAQPKAEHDKAGWKRMVKAGGPRYLGIGIGIGFGEAQARRSHECMFGVRFQLPSDVPLGRVADELNGTAELMLRMAATDPPAVGGVTQARSEPEAPLTERLAADDRSAG